MTQWIDDDVSFHAVFLNSMYKRFICPLVVTGLEIYLGSRGGSS